MALLSEFLKDQKNSLYLLTKDAGLTDEELEKKLTKDAWSPEAVKAAIEARRKKMRSKPQEFKQSKVEPEQKEPAKVKEETGSKKSGEKEAHPLKNEAENAYAEFKTANEEVNKFFKEHGEGGKLDRMGEEDPIKKEWKKLNEKRREAWEKGAAAERSERDLGPTPHSPDQVKAKPGSLDFKIPKGSKYLHAGIGEHKIGFTTENGDTYVAEVHAVNGYDVDEKMGKYPSDLSPSEMSSGSFGKKFGVPKGYKFYQEGMNDTAEGGYILYTSGKFVKEKTGLDKGADWKEEGDTKEYLDYEKLPDEKESPNAHAWGWTVHSDQ